MIDTFSATSNQIRSQIISAIAPDIGTYTFTNGQASIAIAEIINIAEQYPPPGTVIQGLEVVIQYPFMDAEAVLDGYHITQDWVILLKQWDSNKEVQSAIAKVLGKINFLVTNVYINPANPLVSQPEIAKINIQIHQGV